MCSIGAPALLCILTMQKDGTMITTSSCFPSNRSSYKFKKAFFFILQSNIKGHGNFRLFILLLLPQFRQRGCYSIDLNVETNLTLNKYVECICNHISHELEYYPTVGMEFLFHWLFLQNQVGCTDANVQRHFSDCKTKREYEVM